MPLEFAAALLDTPNTPNASGCVGPNPQHNGAGVAKYRAELLNTI